VLVTIAAVALGRDPASPRTAGALALASTGLVLVLAGAAAGALDTLGTVLALGAAAIYSAYILSSEGIAARVAPLVLSTLLCTGAATTATLGAVAGGNLGPGRRSRAGGRKPQPRADPSPGSILEPWRSAAEAGTQQSPRVLIPSSTSA
jgi:drug/metabolite transporter (DMT)-like permease